MEYSIFVIPLVEEDGGGYLSIVPDLPGCMSDGETPEQALANGREAMREWLETAHRRGIDIPKPGAAAARQRRKQDRFLEQLKDLAGSVDHIEERLQDLEKTIREIEERQENSDAWSRFAELTALSLDDNTNQHVGNC